MKSIIPILFFASFFTACKWNNETQDGETIRIRVNLKQLNQTDIMPMIKNIDLIPLETNDNSIFGDVNKLKVDDNHIYILDYNDNPIKMFTKDGKFVSVIGRKGRAPGEYIQISDFLISNDTVFVYAWSANRKWIRYSTDNKFLYETNMSFPFDEICSIDGNRYLTHVGNATVSNESEYFLYCIDKNFEIHSRLELKKPPEDIMFRIPQNHFLKNSEYILYKKDYCDTLFTISQNLTILPKYLLDFGQNWYPKSFLKEYHDRTFLEIYEAINRNEYVKWLNVWETKEQLIISYTIQHNKEDCKYVAIYFKETSELYNYSDSQDNILVKLIMRPYWSDDNQIIGLISAGEILDIASKINTSSSIAEKVKKCAEQIDELDNPILILYSFN